MSDDVRDGLARVLAEHQPTTGMSVASGVTCRCGYWNGNEVGGKTRPVGYQGLQWHQAEQIAALLPPAPEVATTAAELDALPVGSVVRVEGSASVGVWLKVADPHERWMGVEVDREDGWPAVEGAQHWLYDALPARVLYRPTVDGAR